VLNVFTVFGKNDFPLMFLNMKVTIMKGMQQIRVRCTDGSVNVIHLAIYKLTGFCMLEYWMQRNGNEKDTRFAG
jgi:hypothetical protein